MRYLINTLRFDQTLAERGSCNGSRFDTSSPTVCIDVIIHLNERSGGSILENYGQPFAAAL